MTLEEYRIQLVEKLKGCREADGARDLLSAADLVVTWRQLSDQRAFWEALSNDLDLIAQTVTHGLDRQAATALSAVITMAQSVVQEYRALAASDEPT